MSRTSRQAQGQPRTPEPTPTHGAARARRGLAVLLDWHPLLLACLGLLGLLAVFQLPLAYHFQIGLDRGADTDRPFLTGFRDPELTTWTESWRWTQPEATVTVPGVGQRPLLVSFTVVSHRQHWQPNAPQTLLSVATGAGPPTLIPLRYEVSRYTLYVPATAVRDGTLQMRLRTTGWQNPNDSRGALGVALGRQFTLSSAPGNGLVWPGGGLLAAYALGLVLLWLAVRVLGFARNTALRLLLVPLGAVLLLAVVVPPRLAVSSAWAFEAAVLSLVTAGVCALGLPPLLARWGLVPPPAIQRWLLLLMVLTFVLKYGGQLHPVAMPGDMQLHLNRWLLTIWGQIYIPAQHRGLPFPFPNGWYILLAPLSLTGLPLRVIFAVTAGLVEALSVLLFYLLTTRLTGSSRGGLLAGLIAAVSPMPMMNVWWSFQTQVGTQLLTLLLLTLLIVRWPQYGALAAGVPVRWWLALLFILVALGHIGAFINTGLVGLLALPWLWWRARTAEARTGVRQLLWAGAVAAGFVVAFYYSAFATLIVTQVGEVAASGTLGDTERAAVAQAVWLQALWTEGVVGLNGGFLVLFGLVGALLISWSARLRGSIVGPLVWLTFAVGLAQAILPLITHSTITTRWLTFAGWALTVGAALTVLRLRQRGWAGKVVTGLALASVAWLTLTVWAAAMGLNQPPLEPF